MATNTKKIAVSTNTTRVVDDRFAKIASAYTKGFVKVRYIANQILTDNIETITLPESLERVDEATIDKAWGWLNHEMGHIEVQRMLALAKEDHGNPRGKLARCSEKLYDKIPKHARFVGVTPLSLLRTPVEILMDMSEYGIRFAKAYEMPSHAAAVMLKDLLNVTEDPRMEEQVSRRWAGAREHLNVSREFAHEDWKTRSAELLANGTDGSFMQFGCAVIFYLHGIDPSFMGDRVMLMITAVKDILDCYLAEWNVDDAHGFYDAWNCAVALLARVYEVMGGLEPPEAPMFGEPTPEPTPEDDGGEGAPGEAESAGGDDGDAEGSEDGDADTDSEAGDEAPHEGAEGAEGDSDGEAEADSDADADAESGEGGSDGDGEGEGEGEEAGAGGDEAGDGSKAAGSGPLKIGQRIRVKATGKVAEVTAVYEDGSIEATEVA